MADDDEEDQLFLCEAISNSLLHHKVISFYNGSRVLAYLEEEKNSNTIDLIILDINMPHVNGIEVLARIKSMPGIKDIPVVMLSTSSEPAEIETCRKLGALRSFKKPDNIFGLNKLVEDMLGQVLHITV